ncbi:MAG: hypothetical protein KBF73_06960 [Flavobacteriales bacterium]|nr:hypothetical protein [Flavobacteriales bacterium]
MDYVWKSEDYLVAFAQCGPATFITWVAFSLAYLAIKKFGEVENISIRLNLLALPLIWIAYGVHLLLSLQENESRIPPIAFSEATGDVLRLAFYSIAGSVLFFILSLFLGKKKA